MKVPELKIELMKKGWLMKDAAKELDVTPCYLSFVIHGRMQSRRLTRRIRALPDRNLVTTK